MTDLTKQHHRRGEERRGGEERRADCLRLPHRVDTNDLFDGILILEVTESSHKFLCQSQEDQFFGAFRG